jgi:hypothetical protein
MGLASTVLLLTVACVGTPLPGTLEGFPHRIKVPSTTARIATELDPTALPEEARAHLPAYDGDRFFITEPRPKTIPKPIDDFLQDLAGFGESPPYAVITTDGESEY